MKKKRSYFKKTLHNKKKKEGGAAGGVAQGVGPEFKPQYCQKKIKEKKIVLQWHIPVIPVLKRLKQALTEWVKQ
jgi:hypothetical protein